MNPIYPQSGNPITTDLDDDLLMDEEYILECFDREIEARETEIVSLKIPQSVMISLSQVAEYYDMYLVSLIQFYIGQGLHQHLQDRQISSISTSGKVYANDLYQ
jgi:hypothetical protein